MKTNKLTLYFISLTLLATSVMSCSTGRRKVTLRTSRPADILVPPKVKSLLVVDRTKFNKNLLNVAESVLTGEFPEEDKAATQALIQAFRAKLTASTRFTSKVAPIREGGNSMTTAFPKPLSWSKIQALCATYKTDAVVAIEIFDTDFIITHGTQKTKKKVKEGGVTKQVEVNEFYARGVNKIKVGIKFYIPASQSMIDQKLYKKTGTWKAAAASKAAAVRTLISKTNASRRLSEKIGRYYAYRISPMPMRITRHFRGKAKRAPELEQGSRYADVAKWAEAIKVWKSGLGRARNKESGYLAYNIAVGYEVLGDLKNAKEWAQTSYIRYGNKYGKEYYDLLQRRIRNETRAKQQLNKE
ncbi:DUF6340 family protein [Microscilla marina]|uniref:Lipoprotein, putative n=1 Tax=Microscilla marina ATCC 23134 TaxID=313606 RepID=A1ZY93_MICM2|nr:DUF6340 family protein [Microscilla marina]EAY24659.1 lipoprotein, putative [Microscilla marina ATCC 23134]